MSGRVLGCAGWNSTWPWLIRVLVKRSKRRVPLAPTQPSISEQEVAGMTVLSYGYIGKTGFAVTDKILARDVHTVNSPTK